MDAFGDDFSGSAEVDPAAEFLAREHDQLAGLEEDILPESEAAAAVAPDVQGKVKNLHVCAPHHNSI